MSTGIDPAAFTNAFSRQVQLGQQRRESDQIEQARGLQIAQQRRIQALNDTPNATPEQYVRAGDAQAGNALAGIQEHTDQQHQQAVQQAGSIAFQALAIQDPTQRRQAVKQAFTASPGLSDALGVPHEQAMQKLDAASDDELANTLKSLAAFAPQHAPQPVAAGSNLVRETSPGKFENVFTAPGKVTYEDVGDSKVPVDSSTGQVRTDLPRLKKNPTPDATNSKSTFGEAQSALLGAFADRGVSLPAGLRSKEQQIATLNGLLARHPDMTPDQIADSVASGQINFGADKTAQAATLREFSAGKSGATVRSLNVAVQHLDQLSQLADAINSGDMKLANKIRNAWNAQTGNPEIASFDAVQGIVGDELVKAVIGGSGGVADRQETKAKISADLAHGQIADVIKNYKGLMTGQLNGLRQQYTQGTGRQDFERFLLPTTKAALEAHDAAQAGAGGQTPPAAAAPPAAVIQVTSDAQYNALPSGAIYLGPDGKPHKKR